jgi:lipopolysaccharide transport system permease protein
MALLLVAALGFGVRITWAWLAVLPMVVLLELLGFGIGLTLGSLNVFFRDIGQALGIALQMWMWLTPVVYLKDVLPLEYRRYLIYNPAFPVIDALHEIVLDGAWPEPWHWGLAAAWAAGATLLGYVVLRKLRPEIRDAL